MVIGWSSLNVSFMLVVIAGDILYVIYDNVFALCKFQDFLFEYTQLLSNQCNFFFKVKGDI